MDIYLQYCEQMQPGEHRRTQQERINNLLYMEDKRIPIILKPLKTTTDGTEKSPKAASQT